MSVLASPLAYATIGPIRSPFASAQPARLYEELASDPQATLQRACDLIGLEFVPDMVEYWQHDPA